MCICSFVYMCIIQSTTKERESIHINIIITNEIESNSSDSIPLLNQSIALCPSISHSIIFVIKEAARFVIVLLFIVRGRGKVLMKVVMMMMAIHIDIHVHVHIHPHIHIDIVHVDMTHRVIALL